MKSSHHVEIVLPADLHEASISLLKLCELFISGLLTTANEVVDVRVNLPDRSVSCKHRVIRETVRLIVGAGKLDGFVSQMELLLHVPDQVDSLGVLVARDGGVTRTFSFQRNGDAALDWRIRERS